MRNGRMAVTAVAAGAMALAVFAEPMSAKVRVLTHDAADLTPHRVQAALNLGIVAFDVLVTWTGDATKR